MYSKGQFLAFNCDYYKLPKEIDGDDPTCAEFWENFRKNGMQIKQFGDMQEIFCGKGNTPNQALYDLLEQMKNANIKK
jgi:hypothetical protein